MGDLFNTDPNRSTRAGRKAVAISPANTDFPTPMRIYVAVAGNVEFRAVDDSANITLPSVAAGTVLPWIVKRIGTNTTATVVGIP